MLIRTLISRFRKFLSYMISKCKKFVVSQHLMLTVKKFNIDHNKLIYTFKVQTCIRNLLELQVLLLSMMMSCRYWQIVQVQSDDDFDQAADVCQSQLGRRLICQYPYQCLVQKPSKFLPFLSPLAICSSRETYMKNLFV